MSSLTLQLEQLNKQQEELQERIRQEEENKRKLNNEASIDRLEALVQPITERLNYKDSINCSHQSSMRENIQLKHSQQIEKYYAHQKNTGKVTHMPLKKEELLKEEIFVTLIGILKKQNKKINYLESELNKLKSAFIRKFSR